MDPEEEKRLAAEKAEAEKKLADDKAAAELRKEQEQKHKRYGEPGWYDEDKLQRDAVFYSKPDQEEARRKLLETIDERTGGAALKEAREAKLELLKRDVLDELEIVGPALRKRILPFLTAADERGIREQAQQFLAIRDELAKEAKGKTKTEENEVDEEGEEGAEGKHEAPTLPDRNGKVLSPLEELERKMAQDRRRGGG